MTGVDLDGDGVDNSVLASTRINGIPTAFLYSFTSKYDMSKYDFYHKSELSLVETFQPWGAVDATVRAFVAAGDVLGGPGDELIFGMGGVGPNLGAVTIFHDNDGDRTFADDLGKGLTFQPFGSGTPGALRVAAGDLDGKPGDELVVGTAGTGATPQVLIFQPRNGFTPVQTIPMDFGVGYQGGVFVAVGQVFGGAGAGQLIVSQGNADGRGVAGGAVFVYDDPTNDFQYQSSKPWWSFQASNHRFPAEFGGGLVGVNVAAGDFDRDGYDEIVTGQLRGGVALLSVYDREVSLLFRNDQPVFSKYGDARALPGELSRGAYVGVLEINSFSPDDDNDSLAAAKLIKESTGSTPARFDGNINGPGDVDYYSFFSNGVSQFNATVRMRSQTGGELRLAVLDSSGATIAEAKIGEALAVVVPSGMFYVRVSGIGDVSSAYEVDYHLKPVGEPVEPLTIQIDPPISIRADSLEFNDSAASASKLGMIGLDRLAIYLPKLTLHHSDVDYFAFTATHAGFVKATVDVLHAPATNPNGNFGAGSFSAVASDRNARYFAVNAGGVYSFSLQDGPIEYALWLTWLNQAP